MKKIINYFLQGLLYIVPISVTLYVVYWTFQKIDGIFLFQPTSPFRSQKDIFLAIDLFQKNNKHVLSVCKKKTYKFNVNDINGSLYLMPTNILRKFKNFERNGFIKINMSRYRDNIDIDTIHDMKIARKILTSNN